MAAAREAAPCAGSGIGVTEVGDGHSASASSGTSAASGSAESMGPPREALPPPNTDASDSDMPLPQILGTGGAFAVPDVGAAPAAVVDEVAAEALGEVVEGVEVVGMECGVGMSPAPGSRASAPAGSVSGRKPGGTGSGECAARADGGFAGDDEVDEDDADDSVVPEPE